MEVGPGIIAVLVSAALTIRALGAKRFTFWHSHSARWAYVGATASFLVLLTASIVGIATSRSVLGEHATMSTDFLAAAAGQSSLRRMRSPDRGGTLALGFLVDVFKWIDRYVLISIQEWARGLDDDDLVDRAAELDDKTKGMPNTATVYIRAQWRDDFARLLADGGAVRKEARLDLERMIQYGYVKYRIRRSK